MRRPLLSLLLLSTMLPFASVAQQEHPHRQHERRSGSYGTITGRVDLADGKPAEQISVLVKGTSRGTTTAADGSFQLNAPAGWQVLTVTCLGCVPQEITVQVQPRQTVAVAPVRLASGGQQLNEVTVMGAKSMNQRATSVGKMPIAPLDNPQSTVTVERAVLEQQQALRLSDVLSNVAGLYVTSTTGGTQEELGSRGFAYGSSNTFKNGVRFNNGVMPEVSSLERMEVLKGSAAILYGNVAAGGVLNLVTKKPQFERGGSVGLRVGSFGFIKPQFDVYGAVGSSDKVAFRLNGTYDRSNSYRDEVKSNRVYVNPSVLFRLTPKTELLIEGDYLRDNRTPDFGVGAIDYNILESRSRFLNVDNAANATQQTSATATLISRLSNVWQVRAVGAFQRYDNEQRSASRPVGINSGFRPARGTVNTPSYVAPTPKPALYGDMLRSLNRSETAENYYLAQLDLTGTFRTGGIGHTLLVGADADQYNTNSLSYIAQPFDSINVLNRGKVLRAPANAVSGFDAMRYNTRTLGNTRRAGFYAQDLISLGQYVKVLAGLRWSYQETPSDVYTYPALTQPAANPATVKENRRYDSAFSPRLGLVFQPVKTTSLFASYSNSFSPQGNTVTDNQGNGLPPSIIDQYEVGIKNDLFKGVLSLNVTAYQIVNSNQAQTILANAPNYNRNLPSAQELAGEVTSKGVEVDVQSRPYLGWSFITGYSYNNTTYTKSNIYENGSRLRYNPAHTANVSLFYNFGSSFGENGLLKGLTAGVTGYYVGDKVAGRNTRLTVENDAFRLISIPNYVLFDASLGYAYERFSVRFKMANLLNELSYNLHDDNSVNPIAPRSFSATLGYKL